MARASGGGKIYHYGQYVNDKGDVSALCFKVPRAINLRQASWTYRAAAVTCQRCKRMLEAGDKGKYFAAIQGMNCDG